MHALISIHDVMPQTLNRVQDLLGRMSHLPSENISLLVVPGLSWTESQLAVLHTLEDQGFVLAGHGWHHSTGEIRGLYHRLHSTLISRKAAEHLSLAEKDITQLMDDCYSWFVDNKFKLPDLYVPPAWAMGAVSKTTLKNSSFRYFENTAGIYDSDNDRQINLPLVGFEADTIFRVCSLKIWNGLNTCIASAKRPVRLSIHPFDAELLLKHSLESRLQTIKDAVHYRTLGNW